jgi:putative addiction module component (TIGR02574 family)
MSASNIEQLLQQALDLPAEDRLAVAKELLNSVEGREDPEWAEAWSAELKKRLHDVETGAVQTVPWADVKARVLASLQQK